MSNPRDKVRRASSEPDPTIRARSIIDAIRDEIEAARDSAQFVRDELGDDAARALLAAEASSVTVNVERVHAFLHVLAVEIDPAASALRSLEASTSPETLAAASLAEAADAVHERVRARAGERGIPYALTADYYLHALEAGVREFFGIRVTIDAATDRGSANG